MLDGQNIAERELANMKKIENETYDRFVLAVDNAYKTFLARDNTPDSPVVRIGFYSVLDHVINAQPYPIPPVQERLEAYLLAKQVEGVEEMLDSLTELLGASMHISKVSKN